MARPFFLVTAALLGACASSSPQSAPAPAVEVPSGEEPASPPATSAAPPPAAARATASPGCAQPTFGTGLLPAQEITIAGRTRRYELAVPAAHDGTRAYPLVFVFHSGGRTGASARDYFGFAAFAEADGIFVYPDGLSNEWDLDTPAAQNRDVALFDGLLEKIAQSHCVDLSRVFATGSSMGGYLANQLGCRRGSKLRAIAPHSAGGPWENGAGAYDDQGKLRCAEAPPAAMVFHGQRDTSVDPKEAEATVAHWSFANGCTASTAPTTPSPCVAYAGCKKPVVMCRIASGTHRIWDEGPKATWAFFRSF